MVYSQTEGSA